MDKLREMLEAMVSQGEAQFKCGDEYATFNKRFIERARLVLDNHKPMGVQDACKISIAVLTDISIPSSKSMLVSAYMVGQADANLAFTTEQVKDSIQKLVGQKVTF